MVHIFEGVDLSGKSTLAKNQSESEDIPIIKKKLEIFNHARKDWLVKGDIELITQMFFESIYPLGIKYDFILDRGLLSSLVYSKFFNRDINLDYVYEYIYGRYSNYILIKLVYISEEELEKRYALRGDKIFSLDELKIIQKLYLETYNTISSNTPNHRILLIKNDANILTPS